MALFSKKTKETTKKAPQVVKKNVPAITSNAANTFVRKDALRTVLIRPRITEKATHLAEKENTYVFEIHADASKTVVMKAVRTLYSVSPAKVSIVRSPAKKVFVRGKVGYKNTVKKAYITLKKGEKIEFA